MSLGPLLPGRIPNSMLYSRSLQNLNSNTWQYQRLQDQISTGKQFQSIGESPVAALQTILMQQQLERNTQLASNVEQSRSLLSASENVLGQIGNVFNQMKTFVLAGLGDTASATEKQQMASEVDTLIQQVVMLGNTEFRGRYLFGGSQNTTAPFSLTENNNAIRFNGDFQSIQSYVSLDNLLMNNVGAGETLKPLAEVQGTDLNPLLTASTKISDLYGGTGTALGVIEVTVDTGSGPQTERIDLTTAQTVGDLVTRLEAPFAGNLTVSLGTQGLQLTPTTGTVAVHDLPNSRVAAQLGINSAASGSVTSFDLNPRLSLQTSLSSLNGGIGIGTTLGAGLVITNGNNRSVVDLEGLQTVEELFNAIQAADPDVMTGFTDDGQGLRIASRLSGVGFSVGENSGNNATLLGIRTLTGNTPLAALNMGKGVPTGNANDIQMIRRDGSEIAISLQGTSTIQDVLDRINAVDPGNLTATLNSLGNGITLNDNSGTGDLVVQAGSVTEALGIAGTESMGGDLVGTDPNPERAGGVLDLLFRLSTALRTEDNLELAAIDSQLSLELENFNFQRGAVAGRLKTLDFHADSLAEKELQLQESMANVYDTDMALAITQFTNLMVAIQATQQIAAQTMQMNLFNYL